MIPERFHIRLLTRAVFLMSLAFLFMFIAVFIYVYSQFDGTSPAFPIDCAIVFGASVRKGNEPGPGIHRRVATAVRLYRDDKINKIIMTGGKGSPGQDS